VPGQAQINISLPERRYHRAKTVCSGRPDRLPLAERDPGWAKGPIIFLALTQAVRLRSGQALKTRSTVPGWHRILHTALDQPYLNGFILTALS
jgi:hypothetical protein